MIKKITVISLLAIVAFANCKGNQYSKKECEPIVSQMLVNFSKNLKPEEVEKLSALKVQLIPTLQKECTSGKYDLECLKQSSNVMAIQTCKK